ncbi:hypothetical protein GIB67_018288 [Kingdonia uniflora]|uniref:BI1-like protein n=1 Tax=Kingdonia uniflora TaxID=39325 RepID=A0A7J7LF59_9MAGN|nr:hypothetical protein GIB67_018288 [Kingdonia uniflora]
MFQQPPFGKSGDIEAGNNNNNNNQLYPSMIESPQLRWAFIRKIYLILTVQLLLTIAVASVVVFVKPIGHFFKSSGTGLAVYICILIVPFIILCPLYAYRQKHPFNLLLLGLFTLSLAFPVGLSCAFTSGKVILEAVILTAAVVIGLTLYTFWAAKRGRNFIFLGPILLVPSLCSSFLVLFRYLLVFCFILFPLGKLSHAIYGGLGAIVFSGYIIYDTDNLIKRFNYDEYVWATVSLYLDVINLFLALLTLFRAVD